MGKREDYDAPKVSWEKVTAFRLARHHLGQRAPKGGLCSVASDMAGAQAQVLSAGQISLWARVKNLRAEHVEAALTKDRTMVKVSCMRRTMYLIPSKELAIFVRGSSKRSEKEIRSVRNRGVVEHVIDNLLEATLGALDKPLTQSELAERVSKSLGVKTIVRRGGGWGNNAKVPCVKVGGFAFPASYLLHLAGARGVVCSGPRVGNQSTAVRADAWVPDWHDVPTKEAEKELLRKYLRAFGPSTPSDYAWWTGMRLTDVREIWARDASNIVPVDVQGWRSCMLRSDLGELQDSEIERPMVRLLPYFDSFLLGHEEKDHLVDKRHRKLVYRDQGWVSATLLVDGRTRGVWTYTQGRTHLKVDVQLFAPLPKGAASAVRLEANHLGRFLGCNDTSVTIH